MFFIPDPFRQPFLLDPTARPQLSILAVEF